MLKKRGISKKNNYNINPINKKGAISLPISILVAVLISLALFAGGMYFLSSATETTKNVAEAQLQAQTTGRIQQQLQQDEKVILAPLQKELKPEEHFLFSLSVTNTRDRAEDFRYEIVLGKITDENGKEISKVSLQENLPTISFAKEQWLVYDSSFFKIPEGSKATWNFLVEVPAHAPAARYSFLATVYDARGEKYGNPQSFSVIVLSKPIEKEKEAVKSPAKKEILKEKSLKKDCTKDFSCDVYFIFVPVGNWPAEGLFQVNAQERGTFFQEISEFRFKKTGILVIPLAFTQNCQLTHINKDLPQDHLKIKRCADNYADSLGIVYEKAIGLSFSFDAGKAFFREKTMYASLGYQKEKQQAERPGIVAHELGHTYNLCDEYSFKTYQTQNRYLANHPCKNKFPTSCSPQQEDCLGNTPTHRDYAGEPVLNVCQGSKHYSVMGFSTGAECGFDATGGYDAIR